MKIANLLIRAEQGLAWRQQWYFKMVHSVVVSVMKRSAGGSQQIVSRNVHGTTLYLSSSHPLPRYVFHYRFYDTAPPAFAKFLVGRQERLKKLTVIDVGANIGDTARFIAQAVGPEAVRFICVEADEEYLPLLRLNTRDLDATIHHSIAGAVAGETTAAVFRAGGTSSIQAGTGERRRIVSLDDLATDQDISFIKIDTDGYEVDVIHGATQLLTRGVPCFLEFSPWHVAHFGGKDPARVIRFLQDCGCASAIVYDHVGYPMGLVDFDASWTSNIINYCRVKPNFYIDILTARDRTLLASFYEAEMKRLPPFNWDKR